MSAVLEMRAPSARYLEAVQPALVRQFELLATAPGSVARLRELILALAVQGKLVPQDPNDAPTTELLRQINAEKSRLVSAGRIQRQRPSLGAQERDEPFELPRGWAWARLPEISYDLGQGAPKEAFTYIDVAAIDNERAVVTDAVQVVQPAEAPSRARKRVSVGTVLYSTVRPYLKNIAIVEKAYAPSPIVSTAFAVMHPHNGVNAKYLLYYLRSRFFTEFVASKMAGIAYPAINDTSFFSGIVALPPTVEQSRIVARVDELMRLCDALEVQGRLEAEQHARLLGTLLGTLTDSSTPEELAANWQRVADHFDLLLDRPEAVDALEQTILQLAVRGLLVPRDPSEEPGVKDSHRSLDTAEEPVDETELPFDVPANWRWVRLGSQAELINGDRGKNYPNRAEYVVSGVPFINTGHIEPDGTLSHDSMHHLTRAKFESLRSGKTRPGDLVYCLRGATLGKTAIIEYPEGAIASSLVILRFKASVNRRFAYLFLTSPFGRELIRRFDNGSAQPNLAASSVARYVMPLPPIEEQTRIVARVTELRRLCADLRQRLAASRVTQSHLAEALVDLAAA